MGLEFMDIEEMVKMISAKSLKEEAKSRGIKTHCVKKIDLAKQLPKNVLEKLVDKDN